MYKMLATVFSMLYLGVFTVGLSYHSEPAILEKADIAHPSTRVIIIDSGVSLTESSVSDFSTYIDFTEDAGGENEFKDCLTHGTPVAEIFSNEAGDYIDYELIVLKVFPCDKDLVGTGIAVKKALEWVNETMSSDTLTIVNMSMSFGHASEFGKPLVEMLVSKGAIIVTSAGNGATDACKLSPGNVESAITVGNVRIKPSTGEAVLQANSNDGDCIDVYSVGTFHCKVSERISQTCTGTSFASPVIAAKLTKYASVLEKRGYRLNSETAHMFLDRMSRNINGFNYIAPEEETLESLYTKLEP